MLYQVTCSACGLTGGLLVEDGRTHRDVRGAALSSHQNPFLYRRRRLTTAPSTIRFFRGYLKLRDRRRSHQAAI